MSGDMQHESLDKMRVINWFVKRSKEVFNSVGSRQQIPVLPVEILYFSVFEQRMKEIAVMTGDKYYGHELIKGTAKNPYISVGVWYLYIVWNADILERIKPFKGLCTSIRKMQKTANLMRYLPDNESDSEDEAIRVAREELVKQFKQLEFELDSFVSNERKG